MSVSSSRLPGDSKPKGDPRGPAVAIPSVTAEAVLEAADAQVIDLRSPAEFALDHLPGARNVPLFDDLERALIGTLYSRSSPQEAFDEGIQRTRQRVADLTAEIARLAEWTPPGEDLDGLVQRMAAGGIEAMQGALTLVPATLPKRSIVLHCWRGGMRSRSVVALLRNLGLERARLLEGGYKSYRKHVNGSISDWASPPSYVLRGFTGVGKTLVLRALEELCPGWTLDLEGAAGHRSSILGMVGLVPVPQKLFESRLALRLRSGFPSDLVVYEGESRKVGDAIIPETIWRSLRGGTPLDLYAPMAKRVEVLVADYLACEENREPLARQLPFIEERLGQVKWRGVLVQMLASGREEELVEVLLEHYYDPRYNHSEKRFLEERAQAGLPAYAARFDTSDTIAAAEEIATWIREDQRHQLTPS